MCVLFLIREFMDNDSQPENDEKKKSKREKKHDSKKGSKKWLWWGLGVMAMSFALTVLFSFITEITITENSSAILCIVVLLVLLVLNIGCDSLANAIISCTPDAFYAMASNKIKGAKRSVAFCRNASKLGSIFADVIGDICGIVSGAAGAVLAVVVAANGGNTVQIISSIGVSAVIGALTVGGKAIFKHFAIKYSRKIVFAFAKFTTFFVREK